MVPGAANTGRPLMRARSRKNNRYALGGRYRGTFAWSHYDKARPDFQLKGLVMSVSADSSHWLRLPETAGLSQSQPLRGAGSPRLSGRSAHMNERQLAGSGRRRVNGWDWVSPAPTGRAIKDRLPTFAAG